MATNQVYDRGDSLSVATTNPATPKSGDPVRLGDLGGVALTDKRADGSNTVAFVGVFELSVKAVDGAGNSAVAAGDTLYYVDGDTPKLSKKNTGTKFGVALEAVTAGSTATIQVRLAG